MVKIFKPRKTKQDRNEKRTTNEKEGRVGLVICFLYIRETEALKQLQAKYQT